MLGDALARADINAREQPDRALLRHHALYEVHRPALVAWRRYRLRDAHGGDHSTRATARLELQAFLGVKTTHRLAMGLGATPAYSAQRLDHLRIEPPEPGRRNGSQMHRPVPRVK